MEGHFKISYSFLFDDGTARTFPLRMDRSTLLLIPEKRDPLPDWAGLQFHRCPHCSLDSASHAACPIAANLCEVAEAFRDASSMDRVDVAVEVEERTYHKSTTVQHALSPLLGIIMATSGCPFMEPLKPMVRYHLPFASLEETTFRMVAMYLVGQLLRSQEGRPAEWHLGGLARIYADVEKVNKGFGDRMRAAAQNDASLNALVNLDIFAIMVPRVAEDMLRQIRPYFASHLR